MKPIIQVRGLSKQYRIGVKRARYGSLRDSLVNAAKAPFRALKAGSKDEASTIWALKDVSFDVMPGEVVGVIGRNGAGKSTLLKVLTRITEPTKGEVDLYGRVASLLEVGTGFHPELTGRENIYLNGAILGMHKVEIERKFDEIVDFAEVEKFLDTPVKHFSSGMYVRLAFAVAAHLEPEILLVDEVLAVGDLAFQEKCLGKIHATAKSGRTVLFVSHSLATISSLCARALLLASGRLEADGPASASIASYVSLGGPTTYVASSEKLRKDWVIREAWTENENRQRTSQFLNGESIVVGLGVRVPNGVPFDVAIAFFDTMRRPLWKFANHLFRLPSLVGRGESVVRVRFEPPTMNVDGFLVDIAIGPKGGLSYQDHVMSSMRLSLIEPLEGRASQGSPEWPIRCAARLIAE